MPEMEDTQTMEPPPVVIICSIAYLQVKNMPRPSIDMTSSQPSGVASTIDASGMMPAIGNRNVQASVVLDRDLDHLARIRRLRHIRRDEGDIGVDVRENKTRALAGERFCRYTA